MDPNDPKNQTHPKILKETAAIWRLQKQNEGSSQERIHVISSGSRGEQAGQQSGDGQKNSHGRFSIPVELRQSCRQAQGEARKLVVHPETAEKPKEVPRSQARNA